MALTSLALMIATSTMMAEEHAKSGEFYIAVKGLYTTGKTIQENAEVILDGKSGNGIGIDIGYTLPHHFAVELDTSYSQNGVTEKKVGEADTQATAKYMTYAMDIVYTYPIIHSLDIMGKIGYEYEHEKISELGVDVHDNGMVFGAGLEYHISEHYEALAEYEESAIDSARGSNIYAGIKYIF